MSTTKIEKPEDIKTPQNYIDYLDHLGQLSVNGYATMMDLLDTPIGVNTIKSLWLSKKFNLTIEDTSGYSSSSYNDQLVYLSGEDKFGFVIGENRYGFSTIATMLIHELGHILNKNYSEQQVIENYENPYRSAMGYDIRTGYRGNNEWMPYTIQKTSNDVPLQWNYYNGGTSGTANGTYTYTAHKNTESFDVTVVGNDNGNTFEMGKGNDQLIGNGGIDHLYGGAGDDTLIGTDGYGGDDGVADILNGGEGYDTCIAGKNDSIYDSDGSGIIVFESKILAGVTVDMDSTIYPSGEDHTVYYSKVNRGTYYRNGRNGYTFISNGGDTLA